MLHEHALRDALTGLFNRRYLEATLEREFKRVTRGLRPLGLIMLDLDNFKRLNDTFGHLAGDAVLKALGRLLQSRVRGADIACRYGGEEFALVLPEAPLDVTRSRAEQLCEEVSQLVISYDGQVLGPITVSLGVAAFPEHGRTAEVVLRAADQALYRAKAAGRHRVLVADPLG
jgi:diguanylate cyclase (GGDEF)-like protein